MAIVEHEREEAQLEEFERLWQAPAARRRAPRRALPLAKVVTGGWIAFVVAIFAFEPATNADAVVPLWAEATLAAFWLALLVGGALAWLRLPGLALGASAVAGFVGVGLGYACRATEHHVGAFWAVEAAVCGALALLSVAALAARRR